MAYFTATEFRVRYPDLAGGNPGGQYSDQRINTTRDIAERAYEQAIGVALVPRTATERVRPADGLLFLEHPRVRSVVSITAADSTTTDVSTIDVFGGWLALTTGGCWPTGALTVVYSHGYDEPPPRDKQAVMILTRAWMVKGPIDERAVQLATDAGPISLATPGARGSVFGIPEVDAAAAQWPVQRVTVA